MQNPTTNSRTCIVCSLLLFAACSGGGGSPPPDLRAPAVSAQPTGGTFTTAPTLLLLADEAAVIHVSTDGSTPAPGARNTMSGPSPFQLFVQEGTTAVKFCAEDSSGNLSPVQTETYTVDLTDPEISFPNGAPGRPPLLGASTIEWQCAEACDFTVELQSNGNAGASTQIAAGSTAAGVLQQHQVTGLLLGELASTLVRVHAVDRAGRESIGTMPLRLSPFAFVTVGSAPEQLALNGNGDRLYVANKDSNSLSVIDTDPASIAFHGVLTTVAVGTRPHGVAVAPDGSRVYVTNSGATSLDPDSISILDAATNTVSASVPLTSSEAPTGIEVTPDGSRAYVLSADGILMLDTNPLSATYHQLLGVITRQLLLGGNLAITADGTRAIVDWGGLIARGVDVFDVDATSSTFNHLQSSPLPVVTGLAMDVCTSADSRFAYGTDARLQLCRIDLQQGAIDITGNVAGGAVALVPGQPLLLVATASTLTVVDSRDMQRIGSCTAPWTWASAHGIAVSPDGTRVYATCHDGNDNRVAVLQLQE